MKGILKCIFLLLVVVFALSSVTISCVGQSKVSIDKNYMQFLRAQKFMQINGQSKNRKINNYISEDIDELDEDELEENSDMNEHNTNNMKKPKETEFSNIHNEKNMKNYLEKIETEGTSLVSGQACTINEKGVLDVSLNSEDFFSLKKYTVELTSSSLIIIDIENGKENIIKEIFYEKMKLPIETIEETTECWKIKTNKDKILFCETTKQNRDKWITNILKALFCYNINVLTIDQNSNNYLNEKIILPKESTVNERMKKLVI